MLRRAHDVGTAGAQGRRRAHGKVSRSIFLKKFRASNQKKESSYGGLDVLAFDT